MSWSFSLIVVTLARQLVFHFFCLFCISICQWLQRVRRRCAVTWRLWIRFECFFIRLLIGWREWGADDDDGWTLLRWFPSMKRNLRAEPVKSDSFFRGPRHD